MGGHLDRSGWLLESGADTVPDSSRPAVAVLAAGFSTGYVALCSTVISRKMPGGAVWFGLIAPTSRRFWVVL